MHNPIYSPSESGTRSKQLTAISTGTNPAQWRAWWRLHGAGWPTVIELHCAILDHLRGIAIPQCPVCGRSPCANPGFCASCRKADAKRSRRHG
jgi:hypothetical protein